MGARIHTGHEQTDTGIMVNLSVFLIPISLSGADSRLCPGAVAQQGAHFTAPKSTETLGPPKKRSFSQDETILQMAASTCNSATVSPVAGTGVNSESSAKGQI